MIDGVWTAVKNLGYPKGFPDLMGYQEGDGRATGCEIKTIGDTIKPIQTKKLTMMVKDGLLIFTAKERADGAIDLFQWVLNGKKIEKKRSVINL